MRMRLLLSLLLLPLLVPAPARAALPAVKVFVRDAGLYTITAADLAGMGFPASLDPAFLRMTHRGAEVALRVRDGGDGVFGPGDALEFYATGIERDDPLYETTDIDVFWLELDAAAGPRMTEDDPDPAGPETSVTSHTRTTRLEEDSLYASGVPVEPGEDRWFLDARLNPGDVIDLPFTASVPLAGDVTVTVALQGSTDDLATSPNHLDRISLNGCAGPDAAWDGFTAFEQQVTFAASCLNEGANTFSLANLGAPGTIVDSALFDWATIAYPRTLRAEDGVLDFQASGSGRMRFTLEGFDGATVVEVFDVTDPDQARRITNAVLNSPKFGYVTFVDAGDGTPRHYLALSGARRWRPLSLVVDTPSTLSGTGHGADYIIITHPDLMAGMAPLAAHRAAQGLRVEVVDVTDVYDEFADGLTDPAALKRFISHAYFNWQRPAPLYVLLAGDATPNFKTEHAWQGRNDVPTHFYDTPDGGAAPDDNWFAAVDGDDPIPDLLIGRLPVRADRVAGAVAKLIAYDAQTDLDWARRVLFAASEVEGEPVFEEHVDELAAMFPPDFSVSRLFIRDLGGTTVRDRLLAGIADGSLITTFSGHGGGAQWAREKVLVSDDPDGMVNSPRLTFAVGFNCATGYFVEPFDQAANGLSLGEALVSAPDGGAVGVWMTSWKGYHSDHRVLSRRWFEAFLSGPDAELGALAAAAVVGALGDGLPATSVQSFNLLGDPATVLGVLGKGGGSSGGGGGGGGTDGGGGGGGGCAVRTGSATWGDAAGLLLLLLVPLGGAAWRRRR